MVIAFLEINTNEIVGKASPASALNHVMHYIKVSSVSSLTLLIAPFTVQYMF